MLARITPGAKGSVVETYECPACENICTLVVPDPVVTSESLIEAQRPQE